MTFLNIQQIESVLRAAYRENPRDHLMLLLSFTHGLRRGEAATLKVSDVANNQIRVRRLKNSLSTTHPLRKSANRLFDEREALASWLYARESKSEELFPGRKGPLHPNVVSRIAKYYMLKAGVPNDLAHSHALKHACCSIQARAGAKIENIAQFVGHRDIKNTRIYLNVSDEEAAASAFAAMESAK